MKPYKDIPIERAREIAETFDKDLVVIVTWDKAHGRTHVTTFGKTIEESAQAAAGGNRVKRALGWPEDLCGAESERVKQLQEAFDMQQTANTRIATEALAANLRVGRLEMALRDAIGQLQSIANRHLASVAVEHLRAVADGK